ncbi:Hypothetical protein NCS54_00318300 [Fusarium falciforme]|uniref:Hypothetical protein n=1 Tax=Fusarium falciforme TaxID=195108 RepID=UPI00230090C4|nr:Hypothetical protein NCS54_00318300 [Fusarium falciforme]WAO85930.1 Hypothetical protein NCS54_00318300 [Fusarium falciforme]
MDTKDVSESAVFIAFMNKVQNAAAKAIQRKGEMVTDHPSREQAIADYTRQMQASLTRSKKDETKALVTTTQIPPSYLPCIVPAQDLEPIKITDMRLETHHRGKKVTMRVLTQPDRLLGVVALAEDEHGTAVLLQLYQLPDEALVPQTEILAPGMICIVKEPYYKQTTKGRYSVRVDHLGDIIWLSAGDERIPSRWKNSGAALNSDSTDIRTQGNHAVQNQNWAVAQRLYSTAIRVAKTPEEERLASLNRSLTNLKLGRPEKALSDAIQGHDPAAPTEKSLFREARALYDLRDFDQCMAKLQLLAESYPGNKAVRSEMKRVNARLKEQQKGEYNFGQMYKQARKDPPLIDCADFSVPVEVRTSPGRGQGLFTTKAVAAGDLLLCEKAFAYSHVHEDDDSTNLLMNLETQRMIVGGQAILLSQIVQKLFHNPETSRGFLDLHHGNYQPVTVTECDGAPVVDSFLVERIMTLNSFGTPRTSRDSFKMSISCRGKENTFGTCGIWLLASKLNHSCVDNCRRSFIGDMQIIRATKDLPADTELLFVYRSPEPLESYQDVQKGLSSWGFKCECELCLERKATCDTVLQKRRVIDQNLKRLLRNTKFSQVTKARQLLNKLEQTYVRKEPDTPQLELSQHRIGLGCHLVEMNQPKAAIEMIVKGLEALGCIIIACPPGKTSARPKLEVKRWGITTCHLPWAFLQLYQAYESLAPELCQVARGYLEMSYCIAVGEKETCRDTVPGFL